MKKIIEITPKYEIVYSMPEWLFNPFTHAYNRFRSMYPRTSLKTFYDNAPQAFKEVIKVKKQKNTFKNNGAKIGVMYIDEF